MIGAILIISPSGEVLCSRHYRHDIKQAAIDTYLERMEKLPTWSYDDQTHFVTYAQNPEDAIVAAVVIGNGNAMQALVALTRLKASLSHFLGRCSPELVRHHVAGILCILDEAVDNGVPQFLDIDTLRTVIPPSIGEQGEMTQRQMRTFTNQVTGACPWRSPSIKYKRNEVYIDVLENVNALFSYTGDILRCEVAGQIVMKCLLSGVPECKFAINDKLAGSGSTTGAKPSGLAMDSVRFHQCVRASSATEASLGKPIVFIPPDGVFQLLMYRTSRNVAVPFKITPLIQQTGTRVEVSLKLKSTFPASLHAIQVQLIFPTPAEAARVRIVNCNYGKAQFEPGEHHIAWRMKRFQGDTERSFLAEIDLAGAAFLSDGAGVKSWVGRGRAPIKLEFDIPMYTATGLKVRFMKVAERSQYKTTKWVRYLTTAGIYSRRV